MRRPLLIAAVVLLAGGIAAWQLWPDDEAPVETQAPVQHPERDFARVAVKAEGNQPGMTLSGVVKDPSGKPIAGAEVFLSATSQPSLLDARCPFCSEQLLSCRSRETAVEVARLITTGKGEQSAGATVTTDEKGQFRFEKLAGVSFTVWATAPGFGAGMQERAAPGDPVELFLPLPRSIAGRLQDEDGKPITGTVHVVSRRLARYQHVEANAAGEFEFNALGEGPFYVLAEGRELLPAAIPQAAAGPVPVRLTLHKPRRLEVVLKHGGKPVDGTVRVAADHVDKGFVTRDGLGVLTGLYPDKLLVTAVSGALASTPQQVTLEALTTRVTLELEKGGQIAIVVLDENSEPVPAPAIELSTPSGETVRKHRAQTGERVVFSGVGPGDYVVRATAEGFADAALPVKVSDKEAEVELTMTRATVIQGRVLDEYGRAAPGVSVLVTPTGDSVLADNEGRFTARVPSPGLYELHAHHSDWGGGQVKVMAPKSGVELQLEPRAGVRVTVTAGGRRVEGASVVMFIEREGSFRNDRPSGADGVVVMRGMPAGNYWMIASHPDFLPSERRQLLVAENQLLEVAAELKEGAAISGHVVDQLGAPVQGASIFVSPRGSEPVASDSTGAFEIKPLRPKGTYVVRAVLRGFEHNERVLGTAGGDPVKLTMKRNPIFHGRVVGSDGRPIKRYRVDEHEVESTDGRFELPLPATEDRVIFGVEAVGYEPQMFDRPLAPDLGDLTLNSAPALTGIVKDEQGPVADAVVGCDTCGQSVRSDLNGAFSIAMPAFMHEINLVARKGKRSASKRVTMGTPTVELTLKNGTRVEGVVFLPGGQPASGVEVQAYNDERSDTASAVTGPDGRYALETPPGNYRFIVAGPGLGSKKGDPIAVIARVDGESQRLDFGGGPGSGSVTARVRPARGYGLWLVRGELSQLGNPPLELLRSEWAQLVYQPNEERVVFSGIAPGRYTLVWASFHAETPGGPTTAPVTIPASAEVTLVR